LKGQGGARLLNDAGDIAVASTDRLSTYPFCRGEARDNCACHGGISRREREAWLVVASAVVAISKIMQPA
jgi:hypothetical protein